MSRTLSSVAARPSHCSRLAAAFLLMIALCASTPAVAGTVTIAGQLREAVGFGRLGLQQLNRPEAAAKLDDTVVLLDQMYVGIRAALAEMREAQDTASVEDPILDYELAKIERAWTELRGILDQYGDGELPTDEYVASAVEVVTTAVGLIEDALLVMP